MSGIYNKGWGRKSVMKQIRKKSLGKVSKVKDAPYNTCTYRNEDGNCCLVGAFIPDVCAQEVIRSYKLQQLMPMKPALMEELQQFHDGSFGVGDKTGKKFFQAVEGELIRLEREYK